MLPDRGAYRFQDCGTAPEMQKEMLQRCILSSITSSALMVMGSAKKTFHLIAIAAIAAGLAGTAAGWYFGRKSRINASVVPATASAPGGVSLPDAATLKRAADRALRDIGARARSAGVELGNSLSDGSWPVVVRLTNGRIAQGRLYRDRLRWKISLDRRSLFDSDRVIVVEQNGYIR